MTDTTKNPAAPQLKHIDPKLLEEIQCLLKEHPMKKFDFEYGEERHAFHEELHRLHHNVNDVKPAAKDPCAKPDPLTSFNVVKPSRSIG